MSPTGSHGKVTSQRSQCGWNSSPSRQSGTDRFPDSWYLSVDTCHRTPSPPGHRIALAGVPQRWPANPKTSIPRARIADAGSNPRFRGPDLCMTAASSRSRSYNTSAGPTGEHLGHRHCIVASLEIAYLLVAWASRPTFCLTTAQSPSPRPFSEGLPRSFLNRGRRGDWLRRELQRAPA